jgi:hypothetical protein
MCFALCALLLAGALIRLVMSCRYFNHRKIVGNECDRAHNCPCFLGSTPPPSIGMALVLQLALGSGEARLQVAAMVRGGQ